MRCCWEKSSNLIDNMFYTYHWYPLGQHLEKKITSLFSSSDYLDSHILYMCTLPTYPILHWRLANSHLKRNRIGLESDVIWWSHPKSLNISPVASYFYWCTGETVVTAVTTKFLYALTLHWATTQTALDPVGLILHKFYFIKLWGLLNSIQIQGLIQSLLYSYQ